MTKPTLELKPEASPLGKTTIYSSKYDPTLLFPIPRHPKREEIGITGSLPFQGIDIWNGYELSWLNSKGKPVIALAVFALPADSPFIIESKSFKLYLNSFNQTRFESFDEVQKIMQKDLSEVAKATVDVQLFHHYDAPVTNFTGDCIDDQDIDCDTYELKPDFLKTSQATVTETLYTNLLKANCLITSQPDWGSLQITYKGPKICREGLLRYIVSFRNRNEFGEQCIERIYMDLLKYCQPEELTVYGRFTRRGGLDINPFRSNCQNKPATNYRQYRQ